MSNIDDPFERPSGMAPLRPEATRLPPTGVTEVGTSSDHLTSGWLSAPPMTGSTPSDQAEEPERPPKAVPPDVEAEVMRALASARAATSLLDGYLDTIRDVSGDLAPPTTQVPEPPARSDRVVVDGVRSAWAVPAEQGSVHRLVHHHSVKIDLRRGESPTVSFQDIDRRLTSACVALALVRLGVALSSIPTAAPDEPPRGRAVVFRLAGGPTTGGTDPDEVVDLATHEGQLREVSNELSPGVVITAPGPAALRTQVLGPSPGVEIADLDTVRAWVSAPPTGDAGDAMQMEITVRETILIQPSRWARRSQLAPTQGGPG